MKVPKPFDKCPTMPFSSDLIKNSTEEKCKNLDIIQPIQWYCLLYNLKKNICSFFLI